MTATAEPQFYKHPDQNMRDIQDIRRGYAARAVRAGRIRWSATTGLNGGFVQVKRAKEQRIDLETAIALHELLQAGQITVDTTTGAVRAAEEQTSE